MTGEPFDRITESTGICATAVLCYATLYPALREAARRLGWALALHGSLTRDLDVVAIPWTEDAAPAASLVAALVEAAGGFTVGAPTAKPHGRVAVTIGLGGSGGFIDLSIVGAGCPCCTCAHDGDGQARLFGGVP